MLKWVKSAVIIAVLAFVVGMVAPHSMRAMSNQIALADLQLSVGALAQPFTPNHLSYFASVSEAEPTISVRPIATDATALVSVSINGEDAAVVKSGNESPPLRLEIGNNVIVVDVASADGVEGQSYRISIPRRAVRFQEGAGGYTGMADSQIVQAVKYVDHNLGAQHKFEVGYSGPWARDQKYALIRFDRLPLPEDATVIEATLNLWHYGDRASSEILYPEKEVYMHRVLVPWSEGSGGSAVSHDGSPGESGEVTWNTFMDTFAPYDFQVTDYAMVGAEPSWYAFELTELIAGWINNELPNHGVLLKTYEYPSNDDDRMVGTKQFRSREHEVVGERPYLSVIYSVSLTGVTVDRQELHLAAGQDPVTVTAFARPLNAEHDGVTWASSNEAVVTVNQGVITPVAKGVAVVQATISDGTTTFSAAVNVTVE